MTRRVARLSRGAATCACVMVLAAGPALARRRADPATVPLPSPPVVEAPQASPATITPVRDSVDARRLAIGLAASAHARGDFTGVVAALEPLELESSPPFPGADRAAFLLAHAWLELGQAARFTALARAAATWPVSSGYTRWLEFEARVAAGPDPARAAGAAPVRMDRSGSPVADALAASQLLRAGFVAAVPELIPSEARDPLLLALRAAALERLGRDDRAELERLAIADTTSPLARDLVGVALVRLGTLAAARAEDPRPWLSRVPVTSRYGSRARHMSALATLERGDTSAALSQLQALIGADPCYASRREVGLVLAGDAMDHERWDEALDRYREIDADWTREHGQLQLLLAPDSAASLWRDWEHDRSSVESLVLDGLPADSLTGELALLAAGPDTATATPARAEPALGLPAPPPTPGLVPAPAPEAWDRVAASARALAELTGRLTLVTDSLARERARLGDLMRFFGRRAGELHEQTAALGKNAATLEHLAGDMDGTARRLLDLRDAATLHFQRRAAWVILRCELQERWLAAMRHFYLDGPDGARQAATPPRQKGPDVVLAQEQELARSLHYSASQLLGETPRRFIQSYEQKWGPSLIDRPGTMVGGTREALSWARALSRSADSSLAAAATSAEGTRLAALAATLERRAGDAAAADLALRAAVARQAVEHSLAELADEREGVDYGLAAASYARAVRLSASDSLAVAAQVRGARAQGAEVPGALEAATDSVARRDRDEAVSRVSIFLADHPRSAARGEMRFRLADLLISAARVDFRDRMAAWLQAQSQGRALPLPVVDHAQALSLYRQILDEDAGFPHLDAVLFNAGMLLADSGDPAAAGFFSRLLAEHPQSVYVQEASLRLGDLSIGAQRLADAVTDYQRAAAGGDPSLRAIALYKSGWAHFNADRFEDAARAFQGVLDLYAGDAKVAIQADIEHEAEQYFVYSLAAAGGAAAYERAFPAGEPERPYARRVLRAMGQHFRRYGELKNAASVDALYLQRWPADAAALDVVGRLAETQARSERPEEERATRLEWAERFAPGGAWAKAQASDSLKAAGADFARSTWRAEAFERHRKARTTGSREQWRSALETYETLLARWPGDSAAATYELHAGEACAELGEYANALRHYRAAALNGRDSVASRAAWQVVAVTDRWYESTRPTRKDGSAGSDSLARAVIAAADEFLARDPRDPRAADLAWRECQLELAHGWSDQAQAALARFARGFPADARAPRAASERAESYFRAGDFAAAGEAFEEALAVSRRAHADTLARRAEKALPVCAYRAAEAAVASDSTRHERHAELFEAMAQRWPDDERAPVAQYRAGLAWLAAGSTEKGVRALEKLVERWPANTLARDASLKVAQAWESDGNRERAAAAYVEFARRHAGDDDAAAAWLRAADLYDSTGAAARGDELRTQYLARWPNDRQARLEIVERLARRELDALPPEKPLATLLETAKAPPAPRSSARGAARAATAPSYLAQYMKLAAQSPATASKPLLAQVRFRAAQEAFRRCDALRLTQPLPKSIAARQKLLDSVLARCRRTVDLGVPEWAHAATWLVGEALVGFAGALENSERPADLTGDDLKAYENVLTEQSMPFRERGESVWSDLLKQSQSGVADAWTSRARASLWAHLGERFLFEPDVDFPMVEATGPGRTRVGAEPRKDSSGTLVPPRPVASEGHE